MTKTFTILCFLMSFVFVQAQQAVVELSKLNVLYIGVPNPIKIAVANYSCEEIIVNSSQGEVLKKGACEYSIKVEELGQFELEVIAGEDTTYKSFWVRNTPVPIITLGGDENIPNLESVRFGTILAKGGIIPLTTNCDYPGRWYVVSYNIYCISDSMIHKEECMGPMFPRNFRRQVKSSVVIFDDFVLKGPKGSLYINTPVIVKVQGGNTEMHNCADQGMYISSNGDTSKISFEHCDISYKFYPNVTEKYENNVLLYKSRYDLSDSISTYRYYSRKGYLLKELSETIAYLNSYYFTNGTNSTKFGMNPTLRIGSYIESYDDGTPKVSGNYMLFDTLVFYDTTGLDEAEFARGTGCGTNLFIYKGIEKKSVKDGLWTYYNQKGKAIRKEWYEEGVLVKVKK